MNSFSKAVKLPTFLLFARAQSLNSRYFRAAAEGSHVSLSLCFVFYLVGGMG
jgi:hypothetical protein